MLCGSAYKNKGVRQPPRRGDRLPPLAARRPARHGREPGYAREGGAGPDAAEPFSAVVFKIMTDAYAGKLAFFRVYSGRVATGDTILNTNKGTQERVGRIVRMHANQREECTEMVAGRDRRLRRDPEGLDRGHDRRSQAPARPGADRFPGAGPFGRDRAADQGRPGPPGDRPGPPLRGGSDLPRPGGRGHGANPYLRHG